MHRVPPVESMPKLEQWTALTKAGAVDCINKNPGGLLKYQSKAACPLGYLDLSSFPTPVFFSYLTL